MTGDFGKQRATAKRSVFRHSEPCDIKQGQSDIHRLRQSCDSKAFGNPPRRMNDEGDMEE